MATKTLVGATRSGTEYSFAGDEIATLRAIDQIRWEELTPDHVDELAKSIAEVGQQDPVLVRLAADGKPELVAGRHRRAAILQINADLGAYGAPGPMRMSAVFRDLDDEQALIAAYSENAHTRPLTVIDLAHTAHRFKTFEWTDKRIAEAMTTSHYRITQPRVSQLLKLHRAPHAIKQALHGGAIKESAVRSILATGRPPDDMVTLAEGIASGELTVRQLTERNASDKRAGGAVVKRTLAEVEAFLKALDTHDAGLLLSWINGTSVDQSAVIAIFKK
jgi:ParB/RepB/Spo0J family partition protein